MHCRCSKLLVATEKIFFSNIIFFVLDLTSPCTMHELCGLCLNNVVVKSAICGFHVYEAS